MFFDIYMVIITAFAVFGCYCLLEMLFLFYLQLDFPPSVTVVCHREDPLLKEKIKYMQNNIANSNILLVVENDGEKQFYDGVYICTFCEISDYITDVLFTKNTD